MPQAFNKVHQFAENVGKAVHDFTDDTTCTVMVALCAAANAPVAGNSVLADLTQISYTNLSSRIVTGITWEQTAGVAVMSANDLTLTASGGAVATFRYVALYDDDTPSKSLIGWYDKGVDVTLADGESLLLDFLTGILTLG